MARVSLKNVTKTCSGERGRDLPVIKELHLEIQDGALVALVGPPKCGISSVVRMIAGLDEVSDGDVFIGDRRVNDVAPEDRDVAMVPQSYVPYPRMSVYDNLAFALTIRKFREAEIKKRVQAAAELLRLQDLLERKSEALSGEQRQRLAIARGIALKPKTFLFDEALSNLEAEERVQVRNDIVKLHQRLQVTMIYATHDPIEAMAVGGRIVVMRDGVVEQEGIASLLYDEPVNTFVAEFVGSMNLVQGTLKQDRDSFVFREREDGTVEVRLPVSEFPGAGDLAGGSVLLGFRPEDIEVVESTKDKEKHSGGFPAIIDLVEPMGREAILHLQTGAHMLVCRSQRRMDSREVGHRSQFKLDAKKVRLFDPTSRRRVI